MSKIDLKKLSECRDDCERIAQNALYAELVVIESVTICNSRIELEIKSNSEVRIYDNKLVEIFDGFNYESVGNYEEIVPILDKYDKDNVCGWKFEINGDRLGYKTNCGHFKHNPNCSPNLTGEEPYCPYCGRLLKVVKNG